MGAKWALGAAATLLAAAEGVAKGTKTAPLGGELPQNHIEGLPRERSRYRHLGGRLQRRQTKQTGRSKIKKEK